MPITRVSEPALIPQSSTQTSTTTLGARTSTATPGPGATDSRLEIDGTRARQTERPPSPFRNVLANSVSVLMSGAEVATHVVAGPVLAAAVHDARVGASAAIGGPTLSPASPLGATLGTAAGATTAGSLAAAAAGGQPEMATMETMMQSGQASNLQLLALQEQVQEESQRFSTISNVMRAKHDTAKAAVSNIRA